jgi:hypothetical protein
MPSPIGEDRAFTMIKNGIEIGNTKSKKGAFNILYYSGNKIVSIFYPYQNSLLITGGLILEESEIEEHTDDLENTLSLLKEAQKNIS